MTPRYLFIWAFFSMEITFCGLLSPILVGADSSSNSIVKSESKNLTLKAQGAGSGSSTSTSEPILNKNGIEWQQNAVSNDANNKYANMASPPPLPVERTQTVSPMPRRVMFVKEKGPDPNYVNNTRAVVNYDDEPEGHSTTNYSGQPTFDEKSVQRALVVCGGLAALIMVYFGLKFAFLRKRKIGKRYGRIDSEMDLLDEIEDEGESEDEDDTLFDLNSTRGPQF